MTTTGRSTCPYRAAAPPVLWGKLLFLTGDHAEDGHRSILCIDADSGRIQWRRNYPIKRHYLHRDNDFTSATPCVDKDGVIFVWSNPEQILMTALSLDGKEMWQRDLGPYKGLHGSSNSPIIADGLVILANDQMDPKRFAFYLPKDTDMEPGKSFLIALDRKTGETRWKVDRKSELAGYATPCIRRVGGRAEAVFSSTAHGITAVSLRSICKVAASVGKLMKSGIIARSAHLSYSVIWYLAVLAKACPGSALSPFVPRSLVVPRARSSTM